MTTEVGIALVTGGGSGMGQLAAWRLAQRGAQVAAVDVSRSGLADTVDRFPDRIHPFRRDVTRHADVVRLVRDIETKLGPVDRVMNAAGIARVGLLLDQEPEQVARMMEVNFGGTVNVCAATLPGMLERGRGQIVNFASLLGLVPGPKIGAYSATKFAVVAYSEALWLENKGRGVTIACLCPPAVKTPMLHDFFARPEARRRAMAITPDQVLDALERGLRHERFLIIPSVRAKCLRNLYRFTPGLLRRLTSTKRFDLVS